MGEGGLLMKKFELFGWVEKVEWIGEFFGFENGVILELEFGVGGKLK